jgi:Leucine-rich repeat (LRR) protein
MTLDALRRGDLAGARELRLAHCGLTEFPREIFGLAETLEVLDLGGNALSELPADFGRLTRLRVLFGSNNRFARLPPALGDCAELSQVGFRGTGLREVPAEALPPKLRLRSLILINGNKYLRHWLLEVLFKLVLGHRSSRRSNSNLRKIEFTFENHRIHRC